MPIDLRSDTVTLPSPAMRQAMLTAEVGDDVFGEDPTVTRLEHLAAEITGKAAGLFVTSGTQGNLASLLAHCERGREVIVGDESHIYHYENGSASAVGGIDGTNARFARAARTFRHQLSLSPTEDAPQASLE